MMMKILLTGFTPFPGVSVNPSQLLVTTLGSTEGGSRFHNSIVPAVLPTAFAPAQRRIQQLISHEQPDAILCLGVAARRNVISLERIARNRVDSVVPDNDGVQLIGQKIVVDGPDELASTLPLEAMSASLSLAGVPVEFSDDAGGYVCNYIFYSARYELERQRLNIPCGFVHIPALANEEYPSGWSLPILQKSVECCLEALTTGL